jgi:hypothetical protein
MDALFRLGFPEASARKALTEPTTVTRRVIMQKARRHTARDRSPLMGTRAPTACRHVVSGSFPPLTGVLFIFRSRYCALSVASEYLALGDGPPRFSPGFT